jgi:anti-sigma factor RsiW
MSGTPIADIDCIELVERVTEYLDGATDDADRARLEHHLGACPGCAEIVEQFRAVIALTGALRPADVAALDDRVRADLLATFRTWRSERV